LRCNSYNGAASFFTYGADRMRVTQLVNNSDGSVTNTIYIGKGYEHITTSDLHGNNKVQTKHYIHAEGKAIAVHTRTINNGEKEPDQFRYLHHDALESVDTITDSSGIVIQKLSFGAFGKRREINGEGVINPADKEILTNRGYTSHEHLAHLGLIHMNARLYDPETARFLSADIYIQAPESSQSHNRYIYVMNNPLKYSDPSGHFAFSFIIGAVISIISSQIDNPYIRAIGMIAGAALMGGQIPGFEGLGTGLFGGEAIFANAFAAGFVGGGISSGTVKGAFIGGFSALATAGIGHGKGGNAIFKSKWAVAASHGVAQGATAELRGGSFKTGFIGGFAGAYAPNLGIDGSSASDVIARTSVAGIWGGMISEATSGSFRDGAFHAVVVHLFNDEAGVSQKAKANGNWWDSFGGNVTFITDGNGASTSFSFASDGNALYFVISSQEVSGTGYYYAAGVEGAAGTGTILPKEAKYFKQYSNQGGRGIVGGLANPLPQIKGTFCFSGGAIVSNGGISGAVARRGPGVGAFFGEVVNQETYTFKVLPDYKIEW